MSSWRSRGEWTNDAGPVYRLAGCGLAVVGFHLEVGNSSIRRWRIVPAAPDATVAELQRAARRRDHEPAGPTYRFLIQALRAAERQQVQP